MKGSLIALIWTSLYRRAFLNTCHEISFVGTKIKDGKRYNTTDTAKSVDSDVDAHCIRWMQLNWVDWMLCVCYGIEKRIVWEFICFGGRSSWLRMKGRVARFFLCDVNRIFRQPPCPSESDGRASRVTQRRSHSADTITQLTWRDSVWSISGSLYITNSADGIG
jgi:hypothetical protein